MLKGFVNKDKAQLLSSKIDLELLHSSFIGLAKVRFSELFYIKHSVFVVALLNSGSSLLHNQTYSTVFSCVDLNPQQSRGFRHQNDLRQCFCDAGLECQENVKSEQLCVHPGQFKILFLSCFFINALINLRLILLSGSNKPFYLVSSFFGEWIINHLNLKKHRGFGLSNYLEILDFSALWHADIHGNKTFGS